MDDGGLIVLLAVHPHARGDDRSVDWLYPVGYFAVVGALALTMWSPDEFSRRAVDLLRRAIKKDCPQWRVVGQRCDLEQRAALAHDRWADAFNAAMAARGDPTRVEQVRR